LCIGLGLGYVILTVNICFDQQMYEAFIYSILLALICIDLLRLFWSFFHRSHYTLGGGASEPVGREEGAEEEPDEDQFHRDDARSDSHLFVS
jgi:hypothetical protein